MDFSCTSHPEALERIFKGLPFYYLSGSNPLRSYYSDFPDTAGYLNAINRSKPFHWNREVLVNTLKLQHHEYSSDSPVFDTINLLSDENCFTVTTGHQLQFLTGPLFFIYKIITTINLASKLESLNKDVRVIPVFWMATEDHDLEEILDVTVHGKKFRWDLKGDGAVGRLAVPDSKDILNELFVGLSGYTYADELYEIFGSAYREGRSLADATRDLVYAIFGESLLLVVDGDSMDLKRLNHQQVNNEILNGKTFHAVNKTSSELIDSLPEGSVQAPPRDTGYFYLTENQRVRIARAEEDGLFIIGNKHLTVSEIEKELAINPERFSPDALNRPLYQQKILPNISYIGGPAEVAYWLQLKEAFEANNIFFPVIHPRKSVMILEHDDSMFIDESGMTTGDLYLSPEKIIRRFIIEDKGRSVFLVREKEMLEELYEELLNHAARTDPTLIASAESYKKRMENLFKNFEKKLFRAEKKKIGQLINNINTVYERSFPGGVPQERVENISYFYARYGSGLLRALTDCIDPFDFSPLILNLPEYDN